MTDLRNTIAHILEHKQYLEGTNEATTQQYVVLPVLRTLGWNDANLASMEIIPEYQVESRRADYALHIKQRQNPLVFIECKRWDQPIERNEEQICFYAYSGNVPLAIITNGKRWRFYLSRWEASSLSDRIFCETDIEDRENAVVDLQKYLLKSNVVSGEAEVDAKIALEEKGKSSTTKNSSTAPNPNPVDDVPDNPSEEKPVTFLPKSNVKWTIERVKNSLSQELRACYEKNHSEERLKSYYEVVAKVQNLAKKEKWKLKPTKLSQMLCGFRLTDKGVIGKIGIERIFGILPSGRFPDPIMGRDDVLIKKNPTLPRIFVRITKEEAKQLEREHNRCEYYGVMVGKSVDYVYYNIPEDMSILLPVLEFTYKKHTGTNLSDNT